MPGFLHNLTCDSGWGGNIFEACDSAVTECATIDDGSVNFDFAFGIGITAVANAFDVGVAFGNFDALNNGIECGASVF